MTRKIAKFALLGVFLCIKLHALTLSSEKCMAQAIYFEAGNETIQGQYAIGEVIINRVNAHVADSVCGVINQKIKGHWQFGFHTLKNVSIPKNKASYFMSIAHKVLMREDDLRLPASVMYFNNIHFASKKYRLYCKIDHQLFFVKIKK